MIVKKNKKNAFTFLFSGSTMVSAKESALQVRAKKYKKLNISTGKQLI